MIFIVCMKGLTQSLTFCYKSLASLVGEEVPAGVFRWPLETWVCSSHSPGHGVQLLRRIWDSKELEWDSVNQDQMSFCSCGRFERIEFLRQHDF